MDMIKDYIYDLHPIGRGAFSKVYRGYHRWTKIEVAIKAIFLDNKIITDRKKYTKRVTNEVKMMLQFNHPNIIKVHDYYFSDELDIVYIIMEYCPTDLNIILKEKAPLSEKEANKYFCQICDGLQYLLSKKILHRDLKPHNFLITTNDQIKITDFSFAKFFEPNTMTSTICGSPLYMAPELLRGELYTNKSDLWSLGVILYQMLYNRYPYLADTPYKLIERIENRSLSFPNSDKSNECILLIKKLLKKNFNKRITWNTLFRDEWLLKYNYKGLLYSIKLDTNTNYDQYLENEFCIIDEFDSFLIPIESNEPKKNIFGILLSYFI